MLDERTLSKIALDKIYTWFSEEYLKENHAVYAYGFVSDTVYQVFVGVKTRKDLPNRKATEKGWVVYGLVFIDALTGKITHEEFEKE